jgi:hypothetical protein
MTRTAVHVPLFGETKRYLAKGPNGDPKSAEYSDFTIAKELAKRVVALPGEQIIVSGSKFVVQDDYTLKASV